MSFPPSFLEEIRNRLPLSGIVGSRIRMVRAGREFKGCCPFHNEKTPSFYVNDDKQFYHCFGCGAHGDVIGFVMHYDRLSFPEAVESLAAQAGLPVPRDTPIEREKFDVEKRLFQLLDRATEWFEKQLFSPQGREGLAYLRGRGLSEETIRRFRLGYAPADGQALIRHLMRTDGAETYSIKELISVGLAKKAEDRDEIYSFFRNRVIFPVGDRRGRTVAFGARILGDGEPKYLNSPDHELFHKGRLLYGLSRARTALSQDQPIVVVEGYMDVIALSDAGYSGAVAPLGTALTEDQLNVLWKLLPPLESRDASRDYSPVLCFDGDSAGLRAAARAVDRALPYLTPAQTLRIATIEGVKDPDEMIRKSGKSAFDAVLKQAQPLIDVLWNLTLAGRPMRTPEDRGSFTAALKQQIGRIKDEALRELYRDEFKKRIDAAFGWKPKTFNGKKKTAEQTPYLGVRRQPQDRHRAREKILLALIVNHPELFDEVEEQFAFFDIHTPEYRKLRENIIDHFSHEHDSAPTTAELRRALNATGDSFSYDESRAPLDEILSAGTYIGAGRAARPDAPLDEARQAWRAIISAVEEEKIKAEKLRKTKETWASETQTPKGKAEDGL